MRRITLLVFAVLAAGCADRETKQFHAAPIQSPLSQEVAARLANACAAILEEEGYPAYTVPLSDGTDNSMGQAVSPHARLVLVEDFSGTRERDAVHFWRWADKDGYPAGKQHVLHQVISRSDKALRTAGMANSLPDWQPIFEENYEGTLVVQIYYRQKREREPLAEAPVR